ncbi:MAG: DNA polymerase I, partial [Acidobacteriota bacterium]
PTEVVFIFNSMLKKLRATHKPDYLAAVFESEGPNFRTEQFAEYKANRTETPPEFIQQVPYARRLLEALRVPVLEFDRFEADDVIGTISRMASEAGVEVVIVSSDKDMLQLVNDHVSMLNPAKDDTMYDAAKVEEFMGVPPNRVADLLALKGDAVDNIPGAPGIGDKGAKDLILKFGSVEELLDRAAEVERKQYRESLLNNRAQVELSKKLATIDTRVPIEWSLDAVALQPPDTEALRGLYGELEMFTALKDLDASAGASNGGAAVAPVRETEAKAIETAEELAQWLQGASSPVGIVTGSMQFGLAGEGRCASAGEALMASLPASVVYAAHDAKALPEAVTPSVAHDVLLYEFLLEADPGGCTLAAMTSRRLGRAPSTSVEHAASDVRALALELGPEVDKRGLRQIYNEIDLPLTTVLQKMERTGIRIDGEELVRLSSHMEAEIERVSGLIFEIAGHPFNINSPPQLGKVMFEELAVPAMGRTGKTKNYSTAADVLESLAPEHPIAAHVLEFRQLTKLKGTYVDALPALIRAETGRLHTTFNPAGAATGRLSSSNPNLQNIPVRTEMGREIRAAFIPEAGWTMVVADYSQIELRLLAHFSKDPVLTESFRNNEDIHTRTAAEVFGVMPGLVSSEMRRNAKAVNFGIVYGQSAFGLAAQLGIPRGEADRYIKAYFARYAGVKRWIEETIAQVREAGFTLTLHGRRRPIPDMDARNPNARGFAERTAVNTPLQGTAADIIKVAMIHIQQQLEAEGWRSRMLLQVHDELVFEAPPDEVEKLKAMVKELMEGAVALEVPLTADVGTGDNWRDAK